MDFSVGDSVLLSALACDGEGNEIPIGSLGAIVGRDPNYEALYWVQFEGLEETISVAGENLAPA